MVALGKIAHDSVLSALGVRKAGDPFGHGNVHELHDGRVLIDSYHCSRYNTNTGVLTEPCSAMSLRKFVHFWTKRNTVRPVGSNPTYRWRRWK